MKTIKKIFSVVFALSLTVLLAGCGEIPEALLKKAQDNLNKADNFTVTADIEMAVEAMGINLEIPINAVAIVNSKNQTTKADMKISVFGMSINQEIYTQNVDGVTTVYSKVQNVWVKEVTGNGIDEKIFSSAGDLILKEEIKDENKEIAHYKVELPKEKLMQALEMTEQDMSDLVITGPIVADVYINKKTKQFTELSINLVDFASISSEEAKLSKALLTVKIDKINASESVVIPEEALSTAIPKEELPASEENPFFAL